MLNISTISKLKNVADGYNVKIKNYKVRADGSYLLTLNFTADDSRFFVKSIVIFSSSDMLQIFDRIVYRWVHNCSPEFLRKIQTSKK